MSTRRTFPRRLPRPANNFLRWNICSVPGAKATDASCSVVFKYGMKRDFNAWLRSLGPSAPVKTLTELRNFNLARTPRGPIKYGQSQLDNSDEMDLEADRARYQADRAKDTSCRTRASTRDKVTISGGSFPGGRANIVPAATRREVPSGCPQRSDARVPALRARPAPFVVSFAAMACSEPASRDRYAFEQATKRRVPPF